MTDADVAALAEVHRERRDAPPGHVVHMSNGKWGDTNRDSLARCDCGWSHRVPWGNGHYIIQDAAIEAHWRDVESREISTGNNT